MNDATPISERLAAIPHRKLDLTNDNTEGDPRLWNRNRPELDVWADGESDTPCLCITVGAMWGQPQRFLDLSPAEARKLARHLTTAAVEFEAAMGVSES